jgi:hypothetical protein
MEGLREPRREALRDTLRRGPLIGVTFRLQRSLGLLWARRSLSLPSSSVSYNGPWSGFYRGSSI